MPVTVWWIKEGRKWRIYIDRGKTEDWRSVGLIEPTKAGRKVK